MNKENKGYEQQTIRLCTEKTEVINRKDRGYKQDVEKL